VLHVPIPRCCLWVTVYVAGWAACERIPSLEDGYSMEKGGTLLLDS